MFRHSCKTTKREKITIMSSFLLKGKH
jgi:hypothetical protein